MMHLEVLLYEFILMEKSKQSNLICKCTGCGDGRDYQLNLMQEEDFTFNQNTEYLWVNFAD